MMFLIASLLFVLLGLLLVPVTVLLVQVLAALLPRRLLPVPPIERPRLAILVPAHNEALIIQSMLKTVLPQLQEGDRMVVVADNCSDDTAQIARLAGAEVIERLDTERRGKSYALDFGVRYLENCIEHLPPEVVIIIDADCEVSAGVLDRISRLSAYQQRPVQALYLMKTQTSAGVKAAIAAFAWIMKNRVRPLGLFNLGLPCQLMGTGMAFPWPMLQSAQLASGHIVEDMKLGIDLARLGKPALFCPNAIVFSSFPTSDEGTQTQRTRWEHGHLGMISGEAPRLLWDGIRGIGSGLVVLALDMCVPPLAFLTLIIVGLFVLAAIHALVTSSLLLLLMASVIVLLFGIAVFLSWLRFGREAVSFGTLLMVVFYVVRKVPLYLRFFVRRQVEWVRSKRD